ncbi:unnamed protein product, partial [Adineta steineri]
EMAERYPRAMHTTNTLSNIADLRRVLDEIERNENENISGNIRLDAIKKQCDMLQKESRDKLSATEEKQFHARQDLDYISKRRNEINDVIKALNKAE